MPKTNKLLPMPDYIGGGESPEKLLIQKSNPLLSLSETGITLPELKILDVYLSRINSHEPEKRLVRFEKGELEKLLGNTWMHKDDLVKRLKNLFQVIEIADERYPKKINIVSLFEKASCEQDENGLWQVDLMCTQSAMQYIFNVEKLGYLKYKLKSIINLTSRYSYVLYLFLADYCYQNTWEIALDDLKKMLNCTAETYKDYRRFNDLILKKCYKEINEKTDISYTYTTIKRGRTVIAIRFNIERKLNAEPFIDPAKLELPEPEPPKPKIEPKTEPKTEKLPPRPPLPPVRTVAIDGNRSFVDVMEKMRFCAKNQEYFKLICQDKKLQYYARNCEFEFLPEEMQKICDVLFTLDVPQLEFPPDLKMTPEERRQEEFVEFLGNLYCKFYSYAQWIKMTRKQRFNYFYKMLVNCQKEQTIF